MPEGQGRIASKCGGFPWLVLSTHRRSTSALSCRLKRSIIGSLNGVRYAADVLFARSSPVSDHGVSSVPSRCACSEHTHGPGIRIRNVRCKSSLVSAENLFRFPVGVACSEHTQDPASASATSALSCRLKRTAVAVDHGVSSVEAETDHHRFSQW